jgi:hypothetical protein
MGGRMMLLTYHFLIPLEPNSSWFLGSIRKTSMVLQKEVKFFQRDEYVGLEYLFRR